MSLDLAKDVEEFVKEQLRNGPCTNANDLVDDVLRLIRDQQEIALKVTPELEAWLLESADSPTTPLTSKAEPK